MRCSSSGHKFFRPRIAGPELAIEDAVLQSLDRLFSFHRTERWTGGSVPIGSGLPDVISVRYRPQISNLLAVTTVDRQIISYLRGRSATLETIADNLRYTITTAEESLSKLQELGIVETFGTLFEVTDAYCDILPEVITVEAKVKDWRGALQQAIRNSIFAHRSFIALPSSIVSRLHCPAGFERHGIGILEVDEGENVRVSRDARRNTPAVWDYYFQLAVIAARDLNQQRGK